MRRTSNLKNAERAPGFQSSVTRKYSRLRRVWVDGFLRQASTDKLKVPKLSDYRPGSTVLGHDLGRNLVQQPQHNTVVFFRIKQQLIGQQTRPSLGCAMSGPLGSTSNMVTPVKSKPNSDPSGTKSASTIRSRSEVPGARPVEPHQSQDCPSLCEVPDPSSAAASDNSLLLPSSGATVFSAAARLSSDGS